MYVYSTLMKLNLILTSLGAHILFETMCQGETKDWANSLQRDFND